MVFNKLEPRHYNTILDDIYCNGLFNSNDGMFSFRTLGCGCCCSYETFTKDELCKLLFEMKHKIENILDEVIGE